MTCTTRHETALPTCQSSLTKFWLNVGVGDRELAVSKQIPQVIQEMASMVDGKQCVFFLLFSNLKVDNVNVFFIERKVFWTNKETIWLHSNDCSVWRKTWGYTKNDVIFFTYLRYVFNLKAQWPIYENIANAQYYKVTQSFPICNGKFYVSIVATFNQ